MFIEYDSSVDRVLRRVVTLGRESRSVDNPWQGEIVCRMAELNEIYQRLNLHPKELGVWTAKHTRKLDLANFRSDNVYVWQKRNITIENYLVSYLLTKIADKEDLFTQLNENGSYGVDFFEFSSRKISRDLLDSVLEINFMIDMVGRDSLAKFSVLDIGAGYGRLARNLAMVFPEMKIGCIDAIPLSTAISEYYLGEEIERGQIKVYNLAQLDELANCSFDLAVNIHSFSEMSLSSVEDWIGFLKKAKVPRVFVVPNPKELSLNSGEDFREIFERFGYRVSIVRSKFLEGVPENFLLYPANYFYLELE